MRDTDATLSETLRDRIADGELKPGERLSELALAEQLGVSRNTLREAFRVLAEQRLVEHIPHRGVSVTFPTAADVVDIYRVRRVLECGVLAQASPLHPAVASMRVAIEHAEASPAEQPIGTANMAFHAALVSLADSPRLSRSYRDIAAELRLAFLAIDDDESLHRPFVARNRRVLERFLDEGPAAGAEELERYLIESERRVLGAFTRLGFA